MTVIDANVAVLALLDDGPHGTSARAALGTNAVAPELIDLEVGSALRGLVLGGRISARRARTALGDLDSFPLKRVSHRPLLTRCWELRHTLTFYDAAYVAVAELTSDQLVTADGRLARASGIRCRVELLVPAP